MPPDMAGQGFITTPVDPGVRYLGLSAQELGPPFGVSSHGRSPQTDPSLQRPLIELLSWWCSVKILSKAMVLW